MRNSQISALSIAATSADMLADVRGRSQFSEEVAYYSALPLDKKAAILAETAEILNGRFEKIYALVTVARDRMQVKANNNTGDLITLRILETLEEDVLADAHQQYLLREIISSLSDQPAAA